MYQCTDLIPTEKRFTVLLDTDGEYKVYDVNNELIDVTTWEYKADVKEALILQTGVPEVYEMITSPADERLIYPERQLYDHASFFQEDCGSVSSIAHS